MQKQWEWVTGSWAEAMVQQRGPIGVRVLHGLLSLAQKHPVKALESAAQKALHHGAWRLRDLRSLLEQAAPSPQLDFLDIEPLLTRPVGRPSNTPVVWYAGFLYQAKSWSCARRVIAKVEWHHGELFPRIGFMVTNLKRPAKAVVRFYNQRGTAEQWIKEGKNAVKWTRLSCHDFVDNQVRLQLFVLAYNLGNFLRQAVLPRSVQHWTLTTLREKLIKIGAKVVRHSKKVVFQMAEVAVPRELFWSILQAIGRLRLSVTASG